MWAIFCLLMDVKLLWTSVLVPQPPLFPKDFDSAAEFFLGF